jgi:hypothetical protein
VMPDSAIAEADKDSEAFGGFTFVPGKHLG